MVSSSTPRLSIVTITYNDPEGLAITLESLKPLFSSWAPFEWEHVVVDSSPTLNHPVLTRLPPSWPLVHVEQPPRGVYHAFNQALAVVQGTHLWFLNGGDGLHDLVVLSTVLRTLDQDPRPDLVCAGAYLTRNGTALYPTLPWRTFLRNLLGRSWMYHQGVVYRRAALTRVGLYSTSYHVAGDYDFHLRCYLAGLRGQFLGTVLVDYDMTGGSSKVTQVFQEIKDIHRSHRAHLPRWVNWAHEIVRGFEYRRVLLFRTLSATAVGTALRPLWWWLKRFVHTRRASGPKWPKRD